jgi:hypothetical protein
MSSRAIHFIYASYGTGSRSFRQKFGRSVSIILERCARFKSVHPGYAEVVEGHPSSGTDEWMQFEEPALDRVRFAFIRGSNSFNDWSSYAEGLRDLQNRGADFERDWFVIMNSSFFIKYPWRWICRKMGAYIQYIDTDIPAICGFRDSYGFLIDHHPVGGNSGQVSCFCAGLNGSAALLLLKNYQELIGALEGVATPTISDLARLPFPSQIKEFCRTFVFSEGTHFSWTPTIPIQREEQLLVKKTICLILENQLSGVIAEKKGFIVDLSHEIRSKLLFLVFRRLFMIKTKMLSRLFCLVLFFN